MSSHLQSRGHVDRPQTSPGITVAGIGESGLLERILPRLQGAPPLLGPGDDAAVIAAPGGRFVFTIDTMVQNQDFRLNWPSGHCSTGFDVGWKSAAQNLSDVNAMGAVATSAVISLTIPPTTEVRWVEDFADGFSAAVHELGAGECVIAGGDLSRGGELSVTTAVTGRIVTTDPVLRSGAQVGDVVAVGGKLGAAAAGFELLESSEPEGPEPNDSHLFIAGQMRPRPDLSAGPEAARYGATAMMDISDGLLRDLPRLAHASGVAIDVARNQLADAAAGGVMNWARRAGRNPEEFVLQAGEDFALLATFPPSTSIPGVFTPIGRVVQWASGGFLFLDGARVDATGWDHFE